MNKAFNDKESSPVSPIANRYIQGIRLTGFGALKDDESSQAAGSKHQEISQEANDSEKSASRKLSHNLLMDRASCDKQQQETINSMRGNEASFQLNWTGLTFEVQSSVYDRLLNRSISSCAKQCNLRFSSTSDKVKSSCSNDDNVRTIFRNISGYIRSGEMTAIIGPSGAGKTSLLNAICGHTKNYRGEIRLLGASGRDRVRLSIIPQKDYLIENLTVRENLEYSSRILNASGDSALVNHGASVRRVVEMLNLGECLNSRASKISGGEYKRVSIAQELLNQPDILILDEPTSGLDSLNCKKLIRSLTQLKELSTQTPLAAGEKQLIKPIAIVMTIHQPDMEVFHMFDHIYCMARGGQVIFDGRPEEAFARIQASTDIPCVPLKMNPADLLIEIASEEIYGRAPIEQLAAVQRKQISEQLAYDDENHLLSNKKLESIDLLSSKCSSQVKLSSIQDISTRGDASQLVQDKRLTVKSDQHNAGRFWRHTSLLTQRSFKSTVRDPLFALFTIGFHLLIPFALSTVYTKRTSESNGCPIILHELDLVSLASNRTLEKLINLNEQVSSALECSFLFFVLTYSFSFVALTVSALSFPMSMHILLKEVRNGWYSLPAYVLAKSIANFLFEVIFPVVTVVMIYLLLDMPDSRYHWRLCAIALVVAILTMISATQGLIFGAVCMNSVETAVFLASIATLPQVMLSGFVARIRYMPVPVQVISWLSQYRYSNELIAIIRFGFGMCPCTSATDEYLSTRTPEFVDLPRHLKPTMVGILMENAIQDKESLNDRNSSAILNSMNVTTALIPGVDYNVTLNFDERFSLLEQMDAGNVDLFANMAQMVTRAFSFGRKLEGCHSVRSEILSASETPQDTLLPYIFIGMITLLVAFKIVLVLLVKFMISTKN